MVLAGGMQVGAVGAAAGRIAWPVGALVVEVAVVGGALAAGEGALPVAGFDEPGQFSRRLVGAVAEVEQVTGLRFEDHPAPPAVGGQDPGQLGGDGTVAGEFGRVVLQAEQGGQINRHVALPGV